MDTIAVNFTAKYLKGILADLPKQGVSSVPGQPGFFYVSGPVTDFISASKGKDEYGTAITDRLTAAGIFQYDVVVKVEPISKKLGTAYILATLNVKNARMDLQAQTTTEAPADMFYGNDDFPSVKAEPSEDADDSFDDQGDNSPENIEVSEFAAE
jgi:hypothetical protein